MARKRYLSGNVSSEIICPEERFEKNTMDVQKHSKDNSERRTVVIILNASLVNGEIHQKLEANPFCRVRGKFDHNFSLTFYGKQCNLTLWLCGVYL